MVLARLPRAGEWALAGLCGLVAAGAALLAGGPVGVPVGFDVALWTDAALDARWGQPVWVPPLYPRLVAVLGGGGIADAGRWVSVLSVGALPVLAWWLARRAGASAAAALLSAALVASSPDLVSSGMMFGPDALAALVYTAWFAAALGSSSPWVLAVTTFLAVSAREPGLLVALPLAAAVWAGGRRGAAWGMVAGAALSPLAALAVPTSWAEAFPAVHKFAPVATDLARGGSYDYLLDVTAAVAGPLPALETALREAYAARASGLALPGRLVFNALHGVVAHVDLWCVAGLAVAAAWPRRERWVVVVGLSPLLGTLLAWSQRRHFLPFLGLEALALAWAFDRAPRWRWAVVGALLAGGLVLPPAARWARERAHQDLAAASLGQRAREASAWDDFLALAPGERVDPVLLATAERPVTPRGMVDGVTRWRAVVLGDAPGPGWEEVAEGVWRYRPGEPGRDCLRGTVAGTVSFGLVPGDNGQRARVVPGDCGER